MDHDRGISQTGVSHYMSLGSHSNHYGIVRRRKFTNDTSPGRYAISYFLLVDLGLTDAFSSAYVSVYSKPYLASRLMECFRCHPELWYEWRRKWSFSLLYGRLFAYTVLTVHPSRPPELVSGFPTGDSLTSTQFFRRPFPSEMLYVWGLLPTQPPLIPWFCSIDYV